jgi:membrane protease YdiL (CAAX protease family)
MSVKNLIIKNPVTCYFTATFLLSWLGALTVVAPRPSLLDPVEKSDGILVFPVMIICPAIVSISLTMITEGKPGLRSLFLRIKKWNLDRRWYAIALFTPPFLILGVLFFLSHAKSFDFKANFFPLGILYGLPAGFFEEIGWTGYALKKLLIKKNVIRSGIVLGFLWSCWHIPVIDFLGSASPHGEYLVAFFFAFMAIMMAIRMLMVWVYAQTGSVLIVQLMHIISTGSLVVFGPSKISPQEEVLWYALYAGLLWMMVLIILWIRNNRQDHPALQN